MPILKVNDLEIYHEVHGEGEPIVFVGGMTQNLLPWTLYQVPFFAGNGFKCVLLDNRNVGRTSQGIKTDYSIKDLAQDTTGLLDALGIESAHFVGYSMGGMVGLDIASQNPTRLLSLNLLGTAAKISAYDENKLTYLMSAKRGLENEDFWRLIADNVMTWRIFENEEAIERLFGFVTSEANNQTAESMEQQINAIRKFDSTALLTSISVPTCVLVGDEDIMLAPRHSEYLASKIPGAKLIKIPNAGHSAYSEQADIFNKQISEFIGGI